MKENFFFILILQAFTNTLYMLILLLCWYTHKLHCQMTIYKPLVSLTFLMMTQKGPKRAADFNST